jgi:hypothetical protein
MRPRRQLDPRRVGGDQDRAPAGRPSARPAASRRRHGVLEGVSRAKGVRPRRKAAPAVPALLRGAPARPLGARDRAMLPIRCGTALRRPELVGLSLGDVELAPDKGLLLTVARSKTDQHALGQRVAVWTNPTDLGFCPAAALDTWPGFRREAPDLDWTASQPRLVGRQRPLFCAITKTGRVTGEPLSDKASSSWSSKPPPISGSRPSGSPDTPCAAACSRRAAHSGPAYGLGAPVAPPLRAVRARRHRFACRFPILTPMPMIRAMDRDTAAGPRAFRS